MAKKIADKLADEVERLKGQLEEAADGHSRLFRTLVRRTENLFDAIRYAEQNDLPDKAALKEWRCSVALKEPIEENKDGQ